MNDFGPAVKRMNQGYAIGALLRELELWRTQLPNDIRRARDRGLTVLAADLLRLQASVENVWRAAQECRT